MKGLPNHALPAASPAIGAFEFGTNSSDLAITKTAAAPTVVVGDNLTFNLAVTNNGDPNTGVLAADSLPSGLNFASATPTQGRCEHSVGTVSCDLAELAAAAMASVNVVTTTTRIGPVTNTASVIGDVTDPNPDNNADSVNVTVEAEDTTPNSFTIPGMAVIRPNRVQTSAPVVITGINRPASIAVSGASDSQFSIGCVEAAYTSTSANVSDDEVCVRTPRRSCFPRKRRRS
ncbi:MAG: DUF11 domain-containing protein [Panacagrimonas sp.]